MRINIIHNSKRTTVFCAHTMLSFDWTSHKHSDNYDFTAKKFCSLKIRASFAMAREMQTLMQIHRWASAFYLLSWECVRCTAPKKHTGVKVTLLKKKNTFYEFIIDDPKHFAFLCVRKRIFAHHLLSVQQIEKKTHNTWIVVQIFLQCTLTSCLKN